MYLSTQHMQSRITAIERQLLSLCAVRGRIALSLFDFDKLQCHSVRKLKLTFCLSCLDRRSLLAIAGVRPIAGI